MRNDACHKCKYVFYSTEMERYECRINPPKLFYFPGAGVWNWGTTSKWPPVEKHDWCSKYEEIIK